MTAYIESVFDRSVARDALRQFEISKPVLGKPVFGSNAVVEITASDGVFALRVHRPSRSTENIESELRFVSGLHETEDVRVSEPVRTQTGAYCCSVAHGDREVRCSLLRWVDGDVRSPGEGFGIESARQASAALGAIHHYSQSLPARDAQSDDFRLSRRVLEGDGDIRTLFPELAPLVDELRLRLELILTAWPSMGVTHGDFILKNLLCHRRGIGVLDFDDSVNEYYELDFAGMLENLDQARNEHFLQRALLEGYASTAHEADIVYEHHHELIALRHYAGIAWAIGTAAEQSISEDYFGKVTQYRASEIKRLLTKALA